MEAGHAEVPVQLDVQTLRSMLERTLNGVAYCRMVYDDAGSPCDFVYLYTNPAFHLQTGIGSVVGRSVSEIIPGLRQSDSALFDIYGRVAAGGPPERFERYVEGLHQWFQVEAFSTQPGHFVAIFDVITERRQLSFELERHRDHLEQIVAERTSALNEAKAAAESASIAKSAFLANMSHELRTPLSAILGLAHLVRASGVPPEQDDRLRRLEQAGTHLLEIVNSILDLSKIEAGSHVADVRDLRIDDVLQAVASMVQPRADEKHLRLEVHTGGVPCLLRGDATRLQQALLNYVGNAVKFTSSGTVTLRACGQPAGDDALVVRFEVQDTGDGIEPEVLARLFRPFEQGDNSITRRHGGTGLGLSITRRLAELMGGEAGAHSTPGVGSTFWFTARLQRAAHARPLREGAAAAAGSQAAAQPTTLQRPARILVAEDEPVIREIATAVLGRTGAVVDTACDGLDALAQCRCNRYDMVLLDLQMPHMDGLQTARLLRTQAHTAHVPILAITANAFPEVRRDCLEAGMDDFVTKPFAPGALQALVIHWLSQPCAAAAPPQAIVQGA